MTDRIDEILELILMLLADDADRLRPDFGTKGVPAGFRDTPGSSIIH